MGAFIITVARHGTVRFYRHCKIGKQNICNCMQTLLTYRQREQYYLVHGNTYRATAIMKASNSCFELDQRNPHSPGFDPGSGS